MDTVTRRLGEAMFQAAGSIRPDDPEPSELRAAAEKLRRAAFRRLDMSVGMAENSAVGRRHTGQGQGVGAGTGGHREAVKSHSKTSAKAVSAARV